MKNRKKILSICIDAMFLALIVLMAFTPIGFIPLPTISVTIIHIPVLIGAYLFGRRRGALYGLFFGAVSCIKSLQAVSSILDPFFQNPIVSVLPRLIFGYLAGLTFDIIKKFIPKQGIQQVVVIIASFALTLVHSVLVLGTLGLIYGNKLSELLSEYYASFWIFMGVTLTTSSMLEALFASILTPSVSYPLSRFVLKKYFALNSKDKKENNSDTL